MNILSLNKEMTGTQIQQEFLHYFSLVNWLFHPQNLNIKTSPHTHKEPNKYWIFGEF
jgi:hypothetical protein